MSFLGWLILFLVVVLTVAELGGVLKNKEGKVDTISEWFWLIRDGLPKPWRYVWAGGITILLLWTVWHFWFQGPALT